MPKNLPVQRQAGAYLPETSDLVNLTTALGSDSFYEVSGNLVTVFASFVVDQIATGPAEFRCTLPLGQALSKPGDLIGVAGSSTAGFGGRVSGDEVNHLAHVFIDVGDLTAGEVVNVVFGYRLES